MKGLTDRKTSDPEPQSGCADPSCRAAGKGSAMRALGLLSFEGESQGGRTEGRSSRVELF